MRFDPTLLAAKRGERDLSLDEVAARLGLTATTVRRYESGRITPSVHGLAALARVYACPLEDLYDAADASDPVTVADAELRAKIAKFPGFTPAQKSILRTLLRGTSSPETTRRDADGSQPCAEQR
jgi:transcriptional regulator with XRE-family HTH domain